MRSRTVVSRTGAAEEWARRIAVDSAADRPDETRGMSLTCRAIEEGRGARKRPRGGGQLLLPTLSITSLLLVAALGVGVSGRSSVEGPAATADAPAAEVKRAIRWAAGQRATYALSYSGRHETRIPLGGASPQAIEARLELDCDLVLTPLGPRPRMLALELGAIRSASLGLAGEAVLPDATAARGELSGQRAFVELSPRGEMTSLRFAPDAPELFRRVVQHLVGELQVRLGDDGADEWTLTERTPHGVALGRFRAEEGSGLSVTRTRDRYESLAALSFLRDASTVGQEVAARQDVRIDADGTLRSVRSTETIEASRGEERLLSVETRLTLTLRSTAAAELAAADETVEQPLFDVTPSANARREMLRQRAAGMTEDALMGWLDGAGAAGAGPDHNRWLWRATGLLQLEPALCGALAARFEVEGTPLAKRALMMDLLVGAGTPEAQAALRTILGGEAAAALGEAAYGTLFQRLALVGRPDAATARFVEAAYETSEGFVKEAATVTLGAVAAGLAEGGDQEGADAVVGRLRADLGVTVAPEGQIPLIRALGNAGSGGAVDALLSAGTSADPAVRRAVASALRKTPTDEARDALVGLIGDADPGVQASALEVTSVMPLDAARVDEVVGLVLSDRVSPLSYPQLASFVASRVGDKEARAAVLRHMLSRTDLDPALRARLLAMLVG